MIEYVAKFESASARAAEREFFVRSFRELRFWRTVLPPFVFAAALAFIYAVPSPAWGKIEFWVFFLLSVLGPIFFYLVLPIDAARRARKMPARRVRLTPEAFHIQVGRREVRIPWHRFRNLWIARDYLFLIVNPYVCVKLPQAGMPNEARDFIVKAIPHQA